MKKFICFLLPAILITTFFCGCSKSANISEKNLQGYWGRSGEVICNFKDDNTCNIGGVDGTYALTEDKVLNMETSAGYTYSFTWIDDPTNSTETTWNLTDNTLIVGYMQYERINDSDVETTVSQTE